MLGKLIKKISILKSILGLEKQITSSLGDFFFSSFIPLRLRAILEALKQVENGLLPLHTLHRRN